MMKITWLKIFSIVCLSACLDTDTSQHEMLTPEILQNVDTDHSKDMLFGHYENVNTAYGGSYKGCCVFDDNRILLANFVVRYFEQNTGQSFSENNMLIGSTSNSIWVYIVPKNISISTSAPSSQNSYFLEIDKKTAKVISFRKMAE